MAQLFSQMLVFLGVIASAATIVGLGIALFQARVMARRDPTTQRAGRAAGRTARDIARRTLGYVIAATGYGLLAWVILEAGWIIVSNIYNVFVPVYINCYPTLTNVYACSPSVAIQSDMDQIILVGAVLYGLYKGFDRLGERAKRPHKPAPSSKGGSNR